MRSDVSTPFSYETIFDASDKTAVLAAYFNDDHLATQDKVAALSDRKVVESHEDDAVRTCTWTVRSQRPLPMFVRPFVDGGRLAYLETMKWRKADDEIDLSIVPQILDAGQLDCAVASSKTFRSLARLAGAAPSSAGLRASRRLNRDGLRQITAFISRMSSADLAELEGVSAQRAHQLLAGAVVAESAMRSFGVSHVEICPWALREGVILRRLDWLDGGAAEFVVEVGNQ